MSDFRLKHRKTLHVTLLPFPPLFHCNWFWLGSRSGCADVKEGGAETSAVILGFCPVVISDSNTAIWHLTGI